MHIGDQHNRFQNFGLVDKATFPEILENLEFESGLIKEVHQLLANQWDVLESLSILQQLREWFFVQIVAPSIELCLAGCLDDLWKYFTTNDDTVSGFETIEEV